MARDYEDLGLGDLSDRELRDVVRERLQQHNGLDIDDISVRVRDGTVILEGRVGTPEEQQVAEHVMTDVLGLQAIENNLVVDPIRRGETSEDVEEHLAQEDRQRGLLLGDMPPQRDPEDAEVHESEDAQLHGTTDVNDSTANATAWIPPESPTPEGRGEGTTDRG